MIDTLKRASAGRITAVIPYFGYGRTDKKDQPRVPITARLVANLIGVAGADRVLTLDLHAGQIQGFFDVPVDEMTAMSCSAHYFVEKRLPRPVVVSPDLGNTKRARNFAEILDAPLAIIEKRRVGNQDRSEVLNLIGSVEGCQVVIVDDEIDTAGSIMEAVGALKVLEVVADRPALGRRRALLALAAHELLGLAHRQLSLSTTPRTARWSSGMVIAARARPWPSLMRPSMIAWRVSGARSSRRRALLTATRLLPTWRATASWVRPKRSMSSRYASAVSIGLRSARWRFSISASSSESVPSEASRTTAGIVSSPAMRAARSRRSPAISW